jgi:hypothetical protein
MAKYFQINENGKIINIALGDESWAANAEGTWILDIDNNGEISGYYLNNTIYPPAPSEGWIFNTLTFQWEPPQSYPNNYNSDIMNWNNNNTRWEKTDFILSEGQTIADDNTPFTSSYWDPNSTSWIQFFDSRN